MRKVYVTFSNDPHQMVYGPFWVMEDEDKEPKTSFIEDMIDDLDHPKGDHTLWFDNPPKTEKSA